MHAHSCRSLCGTKWCGVFCDCHTCMFRMRGSVWKYLALHTGCPSFLGTIYVLLCFVSDHWHFSWRCIRTAGLRCLSVLKAERLVQQDTVSCWYWRAGGLAQHDCVSFLHWEVWELVQQDWVSFWYGRFGEFLDLLLFLCCWRIPGRTGSLCTIFSLVFARIAVSHAPWCSVYLYFKEYWPACCGLHCLFLLLQAVLAYMPACELLVLVLWAGLACMMFCALTVLQL